MPIKKLFCPMCGADIKPEDIDDTTEESGLALAVEIACPNKECRAECFVTQD